MEIEAELEEFLPVPGGMVDSARKASQATPAAAPQVEVEDQGYAAIRVEPQSPDVFGARTMTIAPSVTMICLPHDLKRRRATIEVVTTGGTVILSQTQGNADGGVGYTLSAGTQLVLQATGILYVNNPGGSTCQVAVLSELYTGK